MPIGVVARQCPVVNPDDAFGTECLFQPILYLLLRHWLVAVGCQQTAGRGEHRSASVALDAAAFEYEVEAVNVQSFYAPFVIESAVDGVVKVGREFLAPAVELEVEESRFEVRGARYERDETVVACPRVVGRRLDDEHWFIALDGFSHLAVGLGDVVKHGRPVSISVRPGQLYAALWLPFCRKSVALFRKHGAKLRNNYEL